jgi:superfamily II DNA/RNA helicase
MHGDMDQRERDVGFREFRSGSSRVLITTDLFFHGFCGYPQVYSHIINYELNCLYYIHRIACRRKIVCINLITEREIKDLKDIEQFYDARIEAMPNNVADLL